MSGNENPQIVQQLYAAFAQGDLGAVLNALAEDFEWQIPGPAEIPLAGTYRGREQVARLLSQMSEVAVFEQFIPQEFLAQEQTVVVLGEERFRVKATGLTVENVWAHVWTLRAGQVTRLREYNDTAAMVTAYRGT